MTDQRTAEERVAYFRRHYLEHRAEKILAAQLRSQANPEAKREYDKQRYLADPLRYRASRTASGKRWEKRYPERVLAKTRKRAASKLKRAPHWADRCAIRMIYRAANIAKVIWPDVQVDHEIPLRGLNVSGLHVHNNLRLMAAEGNQRKGNRF